MDHAYSFEASPQNKPLEQHQKNELYLKTENAIRQVMGEAAAANYLQNNEHYSFGPTGEAVNPLPEMRNLPIPANRGYEHTVSQQRQLEPHYGHDNPNIQSNVIPIRQSQAGPKAETFSPPQGPENGPYSPMRPEALRRALGRVARMFRSNRAA